MRHLQLFGPGTRALQDALCAKGTVTFNMCERGAWWELYIDHLPTALIMRRVTTIPAPDFSCLTGLVPLYPFCQSRLKQAILGGHLGGKLRLRYLCSLNFKLARTFYHVNVLGLA